MPAKIIFFGTAELACATLKALARDPAYQILAVVTQPDKARGRDLQLQPTHVKAVALELGLPVLQPKRARDPEFIAQIRALAPDLMVVVAYGQILSAELLAIPPHGCLNVHTSILPRHRGAAPIQWAILSGDPETGVTIMQMDVGLDTGPILSIAKTLIHREDTGQSLHDRLAQMGADLLLKTIPPYLNGDLKPQPQPADGATYARKISKEDGLINWAKPALEIFNQVRAFNPWPGAFTHIELNGQNKLLKVITAFDEESASSAPPGTFLESSKNGLLVKCGRNALRLKMVQLEGRKKLPIEDFLAGHPIAVGAHIFPLKP